jgi:hypothetical protein
MSKHTFLSKKSVSKNKLSQRANGNRTRVLQHVLLAGIILLALLLLFFGLKSLGLFSPPAQEQKFTLLDECSLVMGKILHPLKDSGDCLVKCRNECQIRSLSYERVEFSLEENSCNVCDCYCR